jgi:putative endonuclease
MPFYVYIIQSERDLSFYKGFSENYEERLKQHNEGLSIYTSRKIPWKLVYAEEHLLKASALKREKNLKKATIERIQALIVSDKNLLNKK